MTEAQIAAVAGEHHVAHKIAMLGFIPTLVRQRMPRVDLLVSSGKGDRTVGVQIKSTFSAMRESGFSPDHEQAFDLRFPLGHRAITSSAGTMFFCFVDLRRSSSSSVPDVYVVPASVLRQEYEGVYLRRYSHLHYERPWQALQPYRNNWDPMVELLTQVIAEPPVERRLRSVSLEALPQRWRNGVALMERNASGMP
jgi:hypothetical protein